MRAPVTERRRQCVRGFIPVAAVVLFALFPAPALADSADDDAVRVFCLSPAERPRLVDAAVALGLAQPGSTPDRLTAGGQERTVEDWRASNRPDFDRGCRALIAARQHENGARSESGSGLLTSLLPALLTGAVGWFFSAQLATAGARRVQADGLRAATRAFVSASEGAIRQLEQVRAGLPPDDDEVHARRSELAAALDRVGSSHRWWRRPATLSSSMYGTTFGPTMTQDWFPLSATEKVAKAAQLRSELGRLSAAAEEVAQALQSSVLPHPGMWRR
jgi:hypothetical protein